MTSRAPPGAHVGVVVEERFRAIKHGLWFTLPLLLIPWLVYFCVSHINMLPSHGNMDPTSPRENFTGRKIDFCRDLRLSFRDFVHVHEDHFLTNTTQLTASLEPSRICAIPIYQDSKGNLALPVDPDATLDRINAIAAAEVAHAGGNAAPAHDPANGMEPPNDETVAAGPEEPVDAVDLVDAEPIEGQAADFPGLEQTVYSPSMLVDMHELMAAEDQPYNPEETVPVDAEPVERRYPIRSNRISYRDPDRVYKITVKKTLNVHGKKALRSI